MQGELLRIWKETGTTVVFVTHSIPESAFLSNRVVVLSARPGEVNSVIDVNLGERTPDTREDPKFFQTTTEIREALRAVEGAV
jgi:NitT/TauT family transport system ATP-binding protein